MDEKALRSLNDELEIGIRNILNEFLYEINTPNNRNGIRDMVLPYIHKTLYKYIGHSLNNLDVGDYLHITYCNESRILEVSFDWRGFCRDFQKHTFFNTDNWFITE